VRRSMPIVAFIVAFIVAVALASPASAEELADPDDVKGKLDLSLVVGNKKNSDGPLRIKIETYENWAKSLLNRKHRNRVWVYFNVDKDKEFEYTGFIYSIRQGKLIMDFLVLEELRVRHPDGHTLRVRVPGDSPPNPEGLVRIAVKSRFKTKTGGCSEGCRDRAPNGGTLAVS